MGPKRISRLISVPRAVDGTRRKANAYELVKHHSVEIYDTLPVKLPRHTHTIHLGPPT